MGRAVSALVVSVRRAWENVIPSFAFLPDVRRVIYATIVIESLHMRLRKIVKARGHFTSDEAARNLPWLALRNVMSKSVRATRVEDRDESVLHPLWRALHQRPTLIRASQTECFE